MPPSTPVRGSGAGRGNHHRFDDHGNARGQSGSPQSNKRFNGPGNSGPQTRNQGQQPNRGGQSGSPVQRRQRQQYPRQGGKGVGYAGPTLDVYHVAPNPPPVAAAVALPKQETVKKTLVNEAKRIEILELMIKHGEDYHLKTESAFFDMIAGLVNKQPGFEGLTGPAIKTRVHNSDICKERRAPGPKRDAVSTAERTADRWAAITSRDDVNSGSAEVERLDDRTVDSLVKASAGTIEAKRGVLSSPDSSRKDWQQAEVIVGLPLVLSTTPKFLTNKQMNAIIKHNRNSAALVRASQASGQGQGQGTGITAAAQKTTITNPRGGAGNGEGPSKPWAKTPVVVDLRTPSPPLFRSGDGKPSPNPNTNKRQSRATRDKTEDIHHRAHEEAMEMAQIVANMKRESVEEDERVNLNVPSHDETTKKSRKHSAMEEEAEDNDAPEKKKKKKHKKNWKKRSEKNIE